MSPLPQWLPDAVRGVVSGHFDLQHYPIGAQLLTDERMEQVWKTINLEARRRALDDPERFESSLNNLSERYRRETYDTFAPPGGEPDTKWLAMMLPDHEVWKTLNTEGRRRAIEEIQPEIDRKDRLYRRDWRVSYLADSACASFFLATAIIFTIRNATVREHDLELEVSRWRDGAKLCREALSSPHRATVEPDLAAALKMSADYFEGWAKFIELTSAGSPYLIKRNAHERAPGGRKGTGGNENVRGQVRELAEATEQIFGTFLYGTVARAASVATGLKISSENVEKWCSGLSRVSPSP